MPTLIEVSQNRKPVEEVVGKLLSASSHESAEAGKKLIAQAKDVGLGIRDYLTLAVDVHAGTQAERNASGKLNGYEAALLHLNLPFGNNFEQGVVLQAAADTFQQYSGTRAMFPEVLDDMLRQQGRIEQIENTAAMIAQTRVIAGTELISTVLNDTAGEDDTFTVSELGRIPVRTIRTGQSNVKMYKHGSGYQFSYEFNRRASLDIVTPFAARVARRLEISKVRAATLVLTLGDGVNGAATAINLGTGYGWNGATGKSLKDNYRAFASFIMQQWKAGVMLDTVLVNFDMYLEFMFMFTPTLAGNASDASTLIAKGTPAINLPIMGGNINIVLSSSMAAQTFLAYVKSETLEELQESGSNISESERSIENQSILYVKSEVTGYKLAFGDTRFLVTVPATT